MVIEINVGIDLDGTIDAYPAIFKQLITQAIANGDQVYIITGIHGNTIQQADVDAKTAYLTLLGITQYTKLVLTPNPIPDNKVKAIQENNIAVMYDNNLANIKAITKNTNCIALLLYNTKIKK